MSGRKLVYNVAINTVLKSVSTVVLSLLSVRLVTTYLGIDGYGLYATVVAFFGLYNALSDIGIPQIVAREIARPGADEERIMGNVLTLRLGMSIVTGLIAPLVTLAFTNYPPEVELGLWIMAAASLFGNFFVYLNGVYQKRLRMDQVGLIEFIGKCVQVGMLFLVTSMDLGFYAVLAALPLTLFWNSLVSLFFVRRYIRLVPKFDTAVMREFLRQSLPLGLTVIITFIYFKFDTILLSHFQPSADVGVYNVAYKVLENFIFFPALLVGLVLPLLTHAREVSLERFEAIAGNTAKFFLIFLIPIIVSILYFAPQVVWLISGGGFEDSALVLRILMGSLLCIFFGHYFTMLVVVSREQKRLLYAYITAAVVNIGLNVTFIPSYSYMATATVSFITELTVVLLLAYTAYRYTHYFPHFQGFWRILLAGALFALGCGLTYLYMPSLWLVGGIVSGLIYLATLWLTRGVTRSELEALFKKGDDADEVVPVTNLA
jgi:O-antigen/teichoic acid export membrane protein